MSTQSGITTSPELLDAFKNLKSQALIIKVSSDSTQLIPDPNYSSNATSSIESLFNSINEYISKEFPHPSYIIIPDNEDYVFISFIPDVAPIKQKMLYASTKNTLLSSLGSYNFPKNKTFAWTELNEVTWSNYNSSVQDTSSGPLSKDEEIIKTLNKLQDLDLSSQTSLDHHGFKKELPSIGGGASATSSGSDILGKFTAELQQEFDSLKDNVSSYKLITFNIKNEEIVLNNTETDVRLVDLIPSLTRSENKQKATPLYAVYNYQINKFAFIYSCPSGSPVRERMVYAASKVSLISHINELLKPSNLSIDKNLEVGDLDELELSQLDGESEVPTPSSASSANSNRIGLKFSKPKGPRRR
ncbi:Twinfilin-1 [Spathaspora sp. JA1]|nr:Twinfilin-1 [Spathaspora sp. JA1]